MYDPGTYERFAVEVLGMLPGPQTVDFEKSGMRWVVGSQRTRPFKLHFIPSSYPNVSYVDALNRMTMLINGALTPW